MTKYCTSSVYGTVDNKTTLELEDDAAHVNWGGNWRMPTKAEFDELKNRNNCTWIWMFQNGVRGYKVISKNNGNFIFLPSAGSYFSDSFSIGGRYHTSSLDVDQTFCSWGFYFDSDDEYFDYNLRIYGKSVRSVFE